MSATNARRLARLLEGKLAEPYFPRVPMPVDITDPVAFPEFELARKHLASLSPERRAELDQEWK